MFGKVKKILGIEGVKMELFIDGPFTLKDQKVTGVIKLTTKTESEVSSITVRIIEKYSRGRNKSKLIDEYVLGELVMSDQINITPEEIIEIPFDLEFINLRSEIDKMSDGNLLMRGPLKLAKLIKNVSSIFRIEAQATVKGTKLQPFAELEMRPK
jgi:hypothetical protein